MIKPLSLANPIEQVNTMSLFRLGGLAIFMGDCNTKYMKELALQLPGGQTITAPGNAPNGGLATSGSGIISTAIQILLLVAILMALFYLIYGGFKWMTSQGDQEKLAGARATIMYAIIGLAISGLSFAIINIFGQFFGIQNILSIQF